MSSAGGGMGGGTPGNKTGGMAGGMPISGGTEGGRSVGGGNDGGRSVGGGIEGGRSVGGSMKVGVDVAIGFGKSSIFRTGAGSEGGANDGRLGILGRLYDGGGGRGTAFDPLRGLNFSRSAMTEFLPLPELSARRLGVLVLTGVLLVRFGGFSLLMPEVGGTPGALPCSGIAPRCPDSGLSVENMGPSASRGATTAGGGEAFVATMGGGGPAGGVL